MPIDGCIELTGGVPERVRNLHQMLTADARHADRLFLDMLRASQLGNIILVSMPTKKTRDDKDPCWKKRIFSGACISIWRRDNKPKPYIIKTSKPKAKA